MHGLCFGVCGVNSSAPGKLSGLQHRRGLEKQEIRVDWEDPAPVGSAAHKLCVPGCVTFASLVVVLLCKGLGGLFYDPGTIDFLFLHALSAFAFTQLT